MASEIVRAGKATVQNSQAAEIFAEVYAETGNLAAACRAAGISEPTGRKWRREPRFLSVVFRERQRSLITDGAGVGLAALREIVTKRVLDQDGNDLGPAAGWAVYAAAAEKLVKLGGHSEAAAASANAGQGAAALHELTEEQLQQHIAAARATLAMLESHVTPDIPTDSPVCDLI